MRADPAPRPPGEPLPVSVIVPTRNAQDWIPGCLEAIRRQHPAQVLVVDGNSTDATLELVARAGVPVLCDHGRGVAAARMIGAQAATQPVLALIDADVVLPDGALAALLAEFTTGGYDGLQFALLSECATDDYWGQALAWHHNHSRVQSWFGVCATLIRRDLLLATGLDESFSSGEDIDLRMRLQRAGARLGVSRSTCVRHRYSPGFATAKDQWTQDGAGLAQAAAKHRSPRPALLPLAATVRGAALALLTAPRYLPYWAGFLTYNYRAMLAGWLTPRRSSR